MRRLLAGFMLSTALVAGCDSGTANPVAPASLSGSVGGPTSSTGAPVRSGAADTGPLTAQVCHEKEGHGYYLLAVTERALSRHLAHGDGLVGGPVPESPTRYFGPACQFLDILENGSFEIGPPIPTQDINILGGSTAITGWTVTGERIDYVGPPWDVSDGVRALDLDGNSGIGGIEQSIPTLPGTRYDVTFDLSGNPAGPPAVKTMQVAVNGVTQVFSHDSTGQSQTSLIWRTPNVSFVASGTETVISFTSLSPPSNSYGAMIDNVVVTGVP